MYCRQLGELRRLSVGEISESGRGRLLAIFAGDEPGVLLAMRRGCTWQGGMAASESRFAVGGQRSEIRHTGSEAMTTSVDCSGGEARPGWNASTRGEASLTNEMRCDGMLLQESVLGVALGRAA